MLSVYCKNTKIYLILSIVACLFIGAAVNAYGGSPKAPDFVLPSVIDGEIIDMNDFKGKVVLVNFWATWCPPCRQEIPSLIKLQNEFGSKGFSVIGISMDEGGTGPVSRFAQKAGINYPVVMGDTKVSRAFGGIIGIPQSFLIDQSGKLLKKYPGFITHRVLRNDIRTLF